MAFKHGQHGQLPKTHQGAAWRCPTCDAENLGPLENGCVSCKAGADAKAAVDRLDPKRGFALSETDPSVLLLSAFLTWRETAKLSNLDTDEDENLQAAFVAGVVWARSQSPWEGYVLSPSLGTGPPSPVPSPAPEGGARLVMLTDDSAGGGTLDPRTHATILAALQFYLENTLAYGPVPGQLSAAEVTSLIAQLTPKEEVPQ